MLAELAENCGGVSVLHLAVILLPVSSITIAGEAFVFGELQTARGENRRCTFWLAGIRVSTPYLYNKRAPERNIFLTVRYFLENRFSQNIKFIAKYC